MHSYLAYSGSEKPLQTVSQGQVLAPHKFFTVTFLRCWSFCFSKKALEKQGLTYIVFSTYDLFSM